MWINLNKSQNHMTNIFPHEISDLIFSDLIGFMQAQKSEQLLSSALKPTATLLNTKLFTELLSNALINTCAFAALKRLSWTITYRSSALEFLSKSESPSYPFSSTTYNLLTIFFHQSQQMKKSGNKNILPHIIVFQKQHRLFVLIIVPVTFILKDLYLESYQPLISLAFKAKEYAFPLQLQISGFELEAYGPQLRKQVCISATLPVQQGSASEFIMFCGVGNYDIRNYKYQSQHLSPTLSQQLQQIYYNFIQLTICVYGNILILRSKLTFYWSQFCISISELYIAKLYRQKDKMAKNIETINLSNNCKYKWDKILEQQLTKIQNGQTNQIIKSFADN